MLFVKCKITKFTKKAKYQIRKSRMLNLFKQSSMPYSQEVFLSLLAHKHTS